MEPSDLISASEAAALLRVSTRTLMAWRKKGGGPPFYKIRSRVRYRRSDIIAWVDGARHDS